ncbi:hypothetical protein R1sor_016661 [Riccia sorocarpa]|uniref:Ycf54 n=1 Tax=Riccia sorocarpa TaxID=122646 RepID=A0ABD3HIG4_9MARC
MATAAFAAQLGVRRLVPEAVVPQDIHRSHGDESRGNANFGCSRHSFASSFSLQHHSSARAIPAARKVVRAVAADKAVESVEPSTTSAPQKAEYHFLVASAQFMLDDEEHFQELMRERLRYFGEKNREQDFWLVIEPSWLSKFPDMEKRIKRPAVALISTDSTWITFMKLRLDRVLKGAFETTSVKDALSGNSDVELKFKKPENWVAPYAKYEGPWWTPFLPPKSE